MPLRNTETGASRMWRAGGIDDLVRLFERAQVLALGVLDAHGAKDLERAGAAAGHAEGLDARTSPPEKEAEARGSQSADGSCALATNRGTLYEARFLQRPTPEWTTQAQARLQVAVAHRHHAEESEPCIGSWTWFLVKTRRAIEFETRPRT
jgi:hypothetical protein